VDDAQRRHGAPGRPRAPAGDGDPAARRLVDVHQHVEPRAVPLDEPQLAEQRRELARRVLPLEPVRVAEDARLLVARRLAAPSGSS
jgi:hypothetical protein